MRHREERIDVREIARSYNWKNLFKPRMWITAMGVTFGVNLFLGLLVSTLIGHGAMEVVMAVTVPALFAIALLGTGLIPGNCAECGRAIKVGYTGCRACGADMAGRY